VKYLVDGEGPSDSFVTSFEPWALDSDPSNDRHQLGYAIFGHWSLYRDPSPQNEAWWSEREATRYMGGIRCRYLRVQAEWDHAQPPNAQWPGFDYPPLWYPCKHAIDLVNLASVGDSPWTRVNGLPLGNAPNSTYSRENPPAYYSGAMANHPGETQLIIREMAGMPPLVPPAAVPGGDAVPGPGAPLLVVFPNPGAGLISLRLPGTGAAIIDIFDAAGRHVERLAGSGILLWDARPRAPGLYFARAAGERTRTARIAVIR
jgi:hypothetical protein